jgi:hypothetical protein
MPDRFPGRTVGENADALPTKNISALGSPPGSVKLWVCGLASVLGDIGHLILKELRGASSKLSSYRIKFHPNLE